MKFTIDRQEKYTILKAESERLNSSLAPELKSELTVIESQGVQNVIVDLSAVKYIDSSGLSALLVGNRVFTEAGGVFVLACVSAHAMKLIGISQLDRVLVILPTVEEAIDAVFLSDLGSGLLGEKGN